MIYTTQRRRFVYDTWDNGSRLDRVIVECTLSITHCLRLNLQLRTIDLVRSCRISSFCTVAWQLARFQLARRIARSLGDSWASCTFLLPAHPVVTDKGPLNGCMHACFLGHGIFWCICVFVGVCLSVSGTTPPIFSKFFHVFRGDVCPLAALWHDMYFSYIADVIFASNRCHKKAYARSDSTEGSSDGIDAASDTQTNPL